MVKCPYCNGAAMNHWRKSSLGPGRVVACESCGKPVAAHWSAIFAALPAFVGGYVLLKSDQLPLGILAVVGGLAAMALLQTFAVPLMRVDGGK
jgi:hypothetical protein